MTFYLKRNVTHNGLCPVMGRITIGKDMVQFSCKLDADPKLWDTRAGRVNGKSDHARSVNRKIDKVNVTIHARYKEIVSLKGTTTSLEVKEAFQGIASSQVGLLELFREHNEEYKKRVGVNRAISTWWNYRNSYNHLERFIIQKYHVLDIPVRQLDYDFIENYDFYLRIDCRQIPGTIISRMTHLRKITQIAVKRAVINRDPFAGYVSERPKTQQRYLPREELKRMMAATFDRPQLDFVRDMFVFASYTGLSFSDMRNLTNDQVVKDDDGSLWLMVNRQKTNTPSNVPLLDVPKDIIERYRGIAKGNKVFPMIACGVTNKHLKEIARQCGIERRLTFHMSRHGIYPFQLKARELQAQFLQWVTI